LRLHAAGFTALRHGVVVRDRSGGWLAEPDLADEVARVAVQHDGDVHRRAGARQWQHDVDRDEFTRAHGWQLVVATAEDDRRPYLLVEKTAAAYRRAAALRGRQVLPPHLR
jgi:Ribonuclease G/E